MAYEALVETTHSCLRPTRLGRIGSGHYAKGVEDSMSNIPPHFDFNARSSHGSMGYWSTPHAYQTGGKCSGAVTSTSIRIRALVYKCPFVRNRTAE